MFKEFISKLRCLFHPVSVLIRETDTHYVFRCPECKREQMAKKLYSDSELRQNQEDIQGDAK